MKKIFTLIAVLGIISGAAVKAQDFPSDPGELKVDLTVWAADVNNPNDTLAGYAPTGGGVYNAGDVASVAAQDIPGYTFLYWSDEVDDKTRQVTVNENTTLIALYEHDVYTIEFRNDDGESLATFNLNYGDQVTPPTDPEKEATAQYTYTFKGWNPEVTEVTGSQVYVALFDSTVNYYAIRFVNWDDELLQSDSLAYGAMPQYRGEDNPQRETLDGYAYEFAGWEPEIEAVTGDQTYVAQFEESQLIYTVTIIIDGDTTTQEATWSEQLELLAPVKEGYHFVSWNDSIVDNPYLVNIYDDATFVAKYEINWYAIRFYNWNEQLLYTDSVQHGEMPQFVGDDPVREEEQGVRFTFKGWTPELVAATADAVYTAEFDAENIEYIVTVILDGDTTVSKYNYGNEVTISAPDTDDRHFLRWTDGNTSADRNVVIVSDTLFQAIYGDSFVDIQIAANQWNFLCLPQKIESSTWEMGDFVTSELSDISWGTYNGAVRAQAQSGWEVPETFVAKQGYILFSATAGRLRLNIYPEDLNQTNVTTSLSAYEAAYPENANWNFVGNPFNAELGADNITVSEIDVPTATVWNGTGYDNMLINTADFKLQPLQAFFIQTSGAGSIAFRGNGSSNPTPRRAPQVEENTRIDIQATSGGYTDKTRVIFRSNSSIKYEAGRDASKFVTASAPIQMYFLDVDNVKCAQMVRPAGDDNMRLGYMLLNAGTININMPVFADSYELYDALTGNSYDLSETVSIYSEKGTFNDRLMLRPIRKVTTGIDNAGAEVVATKVIINDQLYLIRDGKMYSVQGQLVR